MNTGSIETHIEKSVQHGSFALSAQHMFVSDGHRSFWLVNVLLQCSSNIFEVHRQLDTRTIQ